MNATGLISRGRFFRRRGDIHGTGDYATENPHVAWQVQRTGNTLASIRAGRHASE